MDFYYTHKLLLTQGRFRPVMANGHLPAIHISRDVQAVLGVFSDALPSIHLPPETRELYVLNGANDGRIRLHLEGPQAGFGGEVFDILHRPKTRLPARTLGDLIIDVPIGGYARLRA